MQKLSKLKEISGQVEICQLSDSAMDIVSGGDCSFLSLGTFIADALGANGPLSKTWVSMGCPVNDQTKK
jgi:hypothetical protein